MIARIWRGEALPENAEAYRRHIATNVFPSLPEIAGHRGALLLQREVDGRVEFLAVTFWESLEAIHGFAGEEIDAAVVEPEARAVLLSFDECARHYEVACSSGNKDRE